MKEEVGRLQASASHKYASSIATSYNFVCVGMENLRLSHKVDMGFFYRQSGNEAATRFAVSDTDLKEMKSDGQRRLQAVLSPPYATMIDAEGAR